MKRTLKIIAVLVLAQAAALGAYLAVESSRQQRAPAARAAPAVVQTSAMDTAAPELSLTRPDGARVRLASHRGQPLVLHIWATWCEPCREELPDLLDAAQASKTRVLAVSLDPGWEPVRRFLAGAVPRPVLLADGEQVSKMLDVQRLPVTFILDGRGRIRLRLDGARRWSADAIRSFVEQALGRATAPSAAAPR